MVSTEVGTIGAGVLGKVFSQITLQGKQWEHALFFQKQSKVSL